MNFLARSSLDGKLQMNEYTRALLKTHAKENPNIVYEISPRLPESDKLRGYFEGCLVALMTFYQENMDHHNSDDRDRVREWIKQEFNADFVEIDGKAQKIALSTKGREKLNQVSERVQSYLVEQHATPQQALDPKEYKKWRDTIFPYGGPTDYLDYLVEKNVLQKKN